MLVTGRELLPGAGDFRRQNQGLITAVMAAVRGGVSVVQLREKDLAPEDLIPLARELRGRLPPSIPVILNGDLAFALDAGVDGVHFPEGIPFPTDLSADCPDEFLVGRSIHSVEAALRAEAEGAVYLVAGSIFETSSHPGARPQGLPFLKSVCSAVSVPVLAIGGISTQNLRMCLEAGAAGAAVRSPILGAPDPTVVAAQYRRALNSISGE